jgi:NAD-dependent deacetylase
MSGSRRPLRIFVLTGAGVSAESGLGTFRDKDGLWARHDLQEVATPQGFARDPARVHAFYDARRRGLAAAAPNAAHFALAELERALTAAGGSLFLCSQNVDDLHERAGSQAVVHMHGELSKARCLACGGVIGWRGDMGVEAACPACGSAGGFARTWSGSARSRSPWTRSSMPCSRPTNSWP